MNTFTARSRVALAVFLAFGPLFITSPSPASAADLVNNVAVEISIDDEIATTTVTLSTAQETLTVATNELTATSELLDNLQPKQSITEVVNTAIAAVTTASNSLQAANEALTDTGEKKTAYEAAVAAYLLAETNLTPAQASLDEATVNLSGITSEVQTQQQILAAEQKKLDDLLNTPTNGNSFETDGYDDTTTPSTNNSTTIQLPPMWDASTQINVPFDIKLGDTVYEGQGAQSQIYVTSKATITFGQGDHTFWALPPTQGIYVYHSDWMTAGEGAYATVTTTDNTLKVEWSLHRFGDSAGPLTYVTWNMTVDANGNWTGYSEVSGNTENLWGGPRIGVRLTPNGQVYEMTAVPTDPNAAEQIAAQEAKVQVELEKLNVLLSTKNYAVAVYDSALTAYATASAEAQAAYDAEQQALAELLQSLENTNNLTQQATIDVENAVTNTTTTYVIVSNYVASLPSGDFQLTEGQELQVLAPQGYKFGAVQAWYGAPNDPQCGADVSAIINATTNGLTTTTLYSNNSLYGDPCPGVVKVLYVTFAYDVIPAPTPEPTPTPKPTPEPTPTTPPTPTPTPTETPTPEPTVEPTPEPTPTEPTPTETPTPEPSATEQPTPEPTPTEEPEPVPTPEEPTTPTQEVPTELSPEELMELPLNEIVATELTAQQVEALTEAALETFKTAEAGSPEYEQALDALYVAAQADDIVVDEELAAVPLIGNAAVAVAEVLNLLSNVGADMNPEVREDAQKATVAAVIVGQVAQVATVTSTATSASTSTRRN